MERVLWERAGVGNMGRGLGCMEGLFPIARKANGSRIGDVTIQGTMKR